MALFDWVSGEARRPDWYVAGEVPDTLEGRFAMLATIAALVLVRLEQEGDAGNRVSAALTERFVEVMEAEHREMGIGDPTVGRKVRKLVGSLARRVELWRALAAGGGWEAGALDSAYAGNGAGPAAVSHTAAALAGLWSRLEATPLESVAEGRVA